MNLFWKALGVAALVGLATQVNLAQADVSAARGPMAADGCYYGTVVNPVIPFGQPGYATVVRTGCLGIGPDRRAYFVEVGTNVWHDDSNGYRYGWAGDQWSIFTTQGWLSVTAFNAGATSPPPSSGNGMSPEGLKQSIEFQDRHEKRMREINAGPDCFNKPWLQECIQKQRDLHGYDCLTSRDRYTTHCQREDDARAATKKAEQAHYDNKALAEKAERDRFNAAAADATAANRRAEQQRADAAAAARKRGW